MRQGGISVASLNIGRILERRSRCVVVCTCRGYSNEASVPLADKWYRLHIQDLASYNVGGIKSGKLAALNRDSSKRNFLIDASRCEEALVYVLGIIDVQALIIAEECLSCAYQYYKEKKWSNGVAIVIPHGNKLKEDTEEERKEREDKIKMKLSAAEDRKRAFRNRTRGEVGATAS